MKKRVVAYLLAAAMVVTSAVQTDVVTFAQNVAALNDGTQVQQEELEAEDAVKADETASGVTGRETYTDRALIGIDLAGDKGAEVAVTSVDAQGNEYTSGVYLSWRSFDADFDANNKLTTKFTVYKNGQELAKELEVTNLIDPAGSANDTYQVVGSNDAAIGVKNQPAIKPWDNRYLELSLYAPAPETMPADADGDQATCTYSANDMSVGDVDGDGDLELIVKWYPSNAQDNSNSGYTGETFLDTYDVDYNTGAVKLLTRINMGINIRSGAHYTQFQVWDFDHDGKAEVAVKTSDGTTTYKSTDGTDKTLTKVTHVGAVDNTQLPPDVRKTEAEYDYRNDAGHVIVGNEYFSIFNLDDGTKAADDVNYKPERGTIADMPKNWGNGVSDDSYGNRSERYLSATAYLDGENPYAVFCRGYYERMTLTAYYLKDTDNNGIGDTIDIFWKFDTDNLSADDQTIYRSQGNHGLSVNDVDGDGKDEIIYGSATIDDNGEGLYSTGLGHGDAMHVSDWVSWNDGLEIMDVHEHDNVDYHVEIHDAATGELLMGYYTGKDTGRGVAADIDPTAEGAEWWSIASPTYESNDEPEWDSSDGEVYSSWSTMDNLIKLADENPPANFTLFWDGDLLSELQDHSFNKKDYVPRSLQVLKWNYETEEAEPLLDSSEIWTNNGTKGNAGLVADILGDWREEIIARTSDAAGKPNNTVRIYMSTIQTDYVVPCLLENLAYREGVAWQNVGYNQPANLDYLLSEGVVTAQLLAGETTVNSADVLYTAANDGTYGHEIEGYKVYRAEGEGDYQEIATIAPSEMQEFTGELPTEAPEEQGDVFDHYDDIEVVGRYDFGSRKGTASEFIGVTPDTIYSAAVGYGFKTTALSGTDWGKLGFTPTNTDGYDESLVAACSDIGFATSEMPFVVDLSAGTYRVDVYAGGVEGKNSAYISNKIFVNGEDLGNTSSGSDDITGFLKTTTVTLDNSGQITISASNLNNRAYMNAIVITKVEPIYISAGEGEEKPSDPAGDTEQKWYVFKDTKLGENKTYSYKIAAIVDGKTSFLSRAEEVRTSVQIQSIPAWDPIELVQNTPLPSGATTVLSLLPEEMNVIDANGNTVQTPVTWSGYAAVNIRTPGDYTIYANVQGYANNPVATKVTVIPNTAVGLAETLNIRVVINTAVKDYLPETVDLQYLNGTISSVPIAWNEEEIAAINTAEYTEEPIKVHGICKGADYGSADFEVTAEVTVEDDYIIEMEYLFPEIDINTPAEEVEAALPTQAKVVYKQGGNSTANITWSDINVDTSVLGYYTGTATYQTEGYPAQEAKLSVTYPLVKRFDFGVVGSAETDGWINIAVNVKDGTKTMDDLGITYSKEVGYGFLGGSKSVQGRDENYTMEGVLPQSVYKDFVIGDGQTFAVDVPNGVYEVTIVGGSTVGNNNVVAGTFNDKTKMSVTSKPSVYEMCASIVTVREEQLTFKWTGSTCRTNAMIIRLITDKLPSEDDDTSDTESQTESNQTESNQTESNQTESNQTENQTESSQTQSSETESSQTQNTENGNEPTVGKEVVPVGTGDLKAKYKVTAVGATNTVEYTGTASTGSIKIPATINDASGNSYNVTSIANSAFAGNKKITKVTIGKNVKKIGNKAFNKATKLSTVTFEKGSVLTTIGNSAFNGCTALTKITIPAKVTTINKQAFNGCKKLSSVSFASGSALKTIGASAFAGCVKLTKITIPKKVTSIGKNAFKGDKVLATVTIQSTKLKTVGNNAFSGIKKTAKITVPKKYLKDYKKLLTKKAGITSKMKVSGK